MKKYLSLALAALTVLFAASCQKEQNSPGAVPAGTEVAVTFSARIPSDVATKSYTGEEPFNGKVYYEVYTADWATKLGGSSADIVDNIADVSIRLIAGQKYNFLFWAQHEDNNAIEVTNLQSIKIDYSKMTANSSIYDAFCASVTDLYVAQTVSKEVTLTRPFAQLNLGANDTQTNIGTLVSAGSKLVIKSVPNQYDVKTGTASGSAEVTFEAKSWVGGSFSVDGQEYAHITMDQLLPATAGQNVTVDIALEAVNDKQVNIGTVEHLIPNVPLQANYRTNIIGSLFSSKLEFEIKVDPIFSTPDEDYNIAHEIAYAITNGGEVTLQEDLELTEALYISEDVDVIVDLNGHNISGGERPDKTSDDSNSYDIAFYVTKGSLTITDSTGEGKISTKDATYSIPVWAKGDAVVNIEGGYFTNAGDGCELVYASGNGQVYISGGYFEPTAKLGIEEGTANPYTALNVRDADYKAGTAFIVVTGGTFYGFNPADNLSEGSGTNFVAEGYSVTNVGTDTEPVYEVVVATTPDADGNVSLTADGSIVNSIQLDGGVIDGQGHLLSVSDKVATNHLISLSGASTVKNITIEGNNVMFGDKSVRALYFPKGSTATGDIIVNEAHISGVGYAFNTAGSRPTADIKVSNSTLIGWSSFDPHASATFTNVHFGIGNYFSEGSIFNGGLRPYSDVLLQDCTFEEGFNLCLDTDNYAPCITLKNCKVDGVVLTSSNYADYVNVVANSDDNSRHGTIAFE